MDPVARAALERACGIVALKDTQPLRRALFRRKTERSVAVQAALATWRVLGTGRRARAFVGAYGAQSFWGVRAPERDASVWTLAQYANERRQLEALEALVPEQDVARLELEPALIVPRADRPSIAMRRVARALLADYVARGDFLVAARVASTLGYFLRMFPMLARSRARAVWVSSDANPYAVALTAAARAHGLRTCFVTHGHVAEGPPALDFDLAIVDGPAVRDVYARAGTIRAHVVFRGSEGEVRPMQTAELRRHVETLGVFTSILVSWPAVGRAIARLRAVHAPRRVLLRLHPNREMRDRDWAAHLDLSGVEVSDGDRSIEEDASRCALVAAGSSSVHLSVLKLGVPSLYVRDLDELDDDYYRFVQLGILPRATDAGPSREQIAAFYEDTGWPARFAHFDAAYPDRQAACDADVRRALLALVERP